MTVTPHFDIPFRFAKSMARESYRNMVLDDAPVGYWRMQSSDATIDASGRNRPLVFHGTTSPNVSLINDAADQARTFDGSTGYATFTGAMPISLANEFTMECWFNLAVLPSSGNVVVPYAFSNSGPRVVIDSGGQLYWFGAAVGPTNSGQNFTPAGYIGIGKTFHIVMVFDGAYGTGYVNGVPGALGTGPQSFPGAPYDNVGISIGNFYTNANWFNGQVDEVAFYNYAMAPSRIALHYQTGVAGSYVQSAAAENEQDSFEEITDCVEAILRTPLGFRSDVLSFGFPELELTTQPILNAAIIELVSDQEPRAQVVMTEKPDAFDPLIDRITATVSG